MKKILGVLALSLTACVSAPTTPVVVPDCVALARAAIPEPLAVMPLPDNSVAVMDLENTIVLIPEPPRAEALSVMRDIGAIDKGVCLYDGKELHRVFSVHKDVPKKTAHVSGQ